MVWLVAFWIIVLFHVYKKVSDYPCDDFQIYLNMIHVSLSIFHSLLQFQDNKTSLCWAARWGYSDISVDAVFLHLTNESFYYKYCVCDSAPYYDQHMTHTHTHAQTHVHYTYLLSQFSYELFDCFVHVSQRPSLLL